MIRSAGVIRLLAGLLLMATLGPPPASADDLEIAARSVVRVVSEVVIADELFSRSAGSGFAVAPDRIVTNAHVVENGRPVPRAHFLWVIPSDGRGVRKAWLLHYDPDRDLAVLGVEDPIKPIAIYTGELQSDTEVRAFGYPGNVDRAMSADPMDSFVSMPPVRSRGIVSGFRPYRSIEALLTDAPIAAGHSGGGAYRPVRSGARREHRADRRARRRGRLHLRHLAPEPDRVPVGNRCRACRARHALHQPGRLRRAAGAIGSGASGQPAFW